MQPTRPPEEPFRRPTEPMIVTTAPGRLLIALALLAACSTLAACRRVPDREIDLVLLVSIDTLRADAAPWHPQRLRSDRGVESGSWRQLAEELAIWERAVSPSSWTLPAHTSLFTGVLPDAHGATDLRTTAHPTLPLLPELLQESGFETAAFVGGGFVGAAHGLGRGFDLFDDAGLEPAAELDPTIRALEPLRRADRYLRQRRRPDDAPRFVFVHTYGVHDYFITGEAESNDREPTLECLVGRRSCGPEEWQDLRSRYRAAADRTLGELLKMIEGLRGRGVLDRAMLILLSDHGEGFEPEAGRISHGGRLHPDVLRVPLAIRSPSITPGRSAALASLLDVAPTVLDLLRLPAPPSFEGRSLLTDGLSSPAEVLAQEHGFYWRGGTRFLSPEVRRLPLTTAVVTNEAWSVFAAGVVEIDDAFGTGKRRSIPVPDRTEAFALGFRPARPRPETPALQNQESVMARLAALGYLE